MRKGLEMRRFDLDSSGLSLMDHLGISRSADDVTSRSHAAADGHAPTLESEIIETRPVHSGAGQHGTPLRPKYRPSAHLNMTPIMPESLQKGATTPLKVDVLSSSGLGGRGVAVSLRDGRSSEDVVVTPRASSKKQVMSAETRAQVFYHSLRSAAERELSAALVRTPTREGTVAGKDRTPLRYKKIALRENGLASKRLMQVNNTLFDEMIQDTEATKASLMNRHRAFDEAHAQHVALFATSASPAATLAKNTTRLVSHHIRPEEYNPYFPRSARVGAAVDVHQPLVVAVLPRGNASQQQQVHDSVPQLHALPFASPTKGIPGSLALSALEHVEEPSRSAFAERKEENSSSNSIEYFSSCILQEPSAPAAPIGGPDVTTTTAPLSANHKLLLLFACEFVVNQPIGIIKGHFFKSERSFVEQVSVTVDAARRLIHQMSVRFEEWDQLDKSSSEFAVVTRLLHTLLRHSHWTLPSVTLGSASDKPDPVSNDAHVSLALDSSNTAVALFLDEHKVSRKCSPPSNFTSSRTRVVELWNALHR